MRRSRLLHVLLTTIGVGALLAYVMACRPSWSPDGSKILFPYRSANGDGIAVFDRNTGKTQSLFLAAKSDLPYLWAQWDRGGKNAAVLWGAGQGERDGESSMLYVRIVPVDSHKPAREFVVQNLKLYGGFPLGMPLPELDGHLYIGGGVLARLDLETGKVDRRKLENDQFISLLGGKDGVYYVTLPLAAGSQDLEIGTIDPKGLDLRPKVTLSSEDIGELMGAFFAASRDGSAIAFASKDKNTCRLHVVRDDSLQKPIPLDLSAENHLIGNMEWSSDGKHIYAVVLTAQTDRKGKELSVGEITLSTGAVRITPLLELEREGPNNKLVGDIGVVLLWFQIALSPDGRMIAASPAYVNDRMEDKDDCGLYLIDLTTPERKVTKVPIPATLGAPTSTAPKERRATERPVTPGTPPSAAPESGTAVKKSVPELIKALSDDNSYRVRWEAIKALGKARPESPKAVEALRRILKEDKDFYVRCLAAEALGEIGPKAKDAIPDLRDMLERGNYWEKNAARKALRNMGEAPQ